MVKKIKKMFFDKYSEHLIVVVLCTVSILAAFIFVSDGSHLLYGDALSRLNISRKLTDNLTPGLGQLGNVWLPLPQILMMPFTANEYLWHSGIAGTLISSVFFVIGGFFISKTIYKLTNSLSASIFGTATYAFNINILYMQTTAMSEVLFIALLSIFTYTLYMWTKTQKHSYLMVSAFSVSALTLVRYEGLAILFSSVLFIGLFSYLKEANKNKTEGLLVLFVTLAGLGFSLWTLYLTVIFGDPLYWKNYYVGSQPIIALDGSVAHKDTIGLFQSIWWYLTTVVWMNGLIPVTISLVGFSLVIHRIIKKKSYELLGVLLSFSIFAFMVLTLMRNTPIHQPLLNLQSILDSSTSHFAEFNIRYGLLMAPVVAILCAYLFSVKNMVLKVLLSALFSIQLVSYFYPLYTVIFQMPITISESIGPGGQRSRAYVNWLKKNYDGGLILISALKHDPQMFQLGFVFKTYIHEGAGDYWRESMKDPRKYAKWVVMDYVNKDDQVTKFLKDSPILEESYDIVYEVDDIRIYKRKESNNKETKIID